MPENKVGNAGVVRTQMLQAENSGQFDQEPGVTTVTYFQCEDFDKTVALVRGRVEKVLELNRWLLGSLVKVSGKLHLEWDSQCDIGASMPQVFFARTKSQFDLKYKCSYAGICKALGNKKNPAWVLAGKSLKNKRDQRLFKVGVFQCSDDDKMVGLVASLSHTVGDGHTYYTILNMLWDGGSPSALTVEREHKFHEAQKDVLGKKEVSLLFSKLLMANYFWKFVRDRVLAKKTNLSLFYIDDEKVKVLKEEAASNGEVPYVSTNDIVSSHFFKLSNSQVSMMAINLRNRVGHLPDINEATAGNYENVIVFGRGDYERPALIRKAMMKPGGVFRRAGSDPPSKLPDGMSRLTCSWCMITNWSTFAKEPALEGCSLKLHLPTGELSTVPMDFCVVFVADKGRHGVLLVGPHMNHRELKARFAKPEYPFGDEFPSHLFT